jgi:Fic family protein
LVLEIFKEGKISRKDYSLVHRDISTATASRDLLYGVEQGVLVKTGIHNKARYQFV